MAGDEGDVVRTVVRNGYGEYGEVIADPHEVESFEVRRKFWK